MQPELVEVQLGPGLAGVRGPLGHARQTSAFLSGWTFGSLFLGRRRFVERSLGMDMADEMNVRGEVRKNALTAVGAVTEDDDLIVGEPSGREMDEFEGQSRSRAMLGISL